MQTPRLILASALVLAAAPALAEDLSYTYAEIDYVSADVGVSGSGFSLRGSYAVSDDFYVIGDYSDYGFDNAFFGLDVDVGETRLGLGWRQSLTSDVDLIAEFNWQRLNASIETLGSGSDNGWGIAIGARGMVKDGLELNGKLRRVDYGGGASDTLIGAGLVYSFGENMAVTFGYESGDTDTLNLGVRFGF